VYHYVNKYKKKHDVKKSRTITIFDVNKLWHKTQLKPVKMPETTQVSFVSHWDTSTVYIHYGILHYSRKIQLANKDDLLGGCCLLGRMAFLHQRSPNEFVWLVMFFKATDKLKLLSLYYKHIKFLLRLPSWTRNRYVTGQYSVINPEEGLDSYGCYKLTNWAT